jgi:hypothetical protein
LASTASASTTLSAAFPGEAGAFGELFFAGIADDIADGDDDAKRPNASLFRRCALSASAFRAVLQGAGFIPNDP